MKKDELIREVAIKTCLSTKDARSAVNAVLETICEQIEKGEEISFTGFGAFGCKKTPARMARNPRTGETVQVAPGCKPIFKPGKDLKEAAAKAI